MGKRCQSGHYIKNISRIKKDILTGVYQEETQVPTELELSENMMLVGLRLSEH